MKNLCKPGVILLCSWLNSCAVVEKSKLQWRYDGRVFSPLAEVNTGLDNAYYAFDTPEGLYLAGFKIDNKNINHPYLVFISKQLNGQIQWPQNQAVEQLFFYKKQLYLLDETGQTQIKSDNQWREHPLTLTAHSRVITSEKALIACVPTPLASADYTRGHCYSITKNWRVDIAWRSVTPTLCNNILVAVSDYPSRGTLHQIDINNGKIIKSASEPHIIPGQNLCDLLMN
ncbi:hypothetical protein [Thalassomonas actiniarum]|uniref:Uncharacterized protein n=1 Tax=Thalassomonas actiniarum TaxID=485447 RepID=A0AAF0C3E5_9GAMM|nr:hypothetical protein [Thalassomonas actiniarum]WDD98604.1 hypothetical protein SG35_025695 [Thalassomonas actiniarum]